MTHDRVVSFYSGGVDHRGRTLAEILVWPDAELEAVHDYIQWMFPTAAPSPVNPAAPLVTRSTRASFAASPGLQSALRRSLDRMLAFYGLRRETKRAGTVRIEIDPARFSDRASVWLRRGNHNHLRLTRIMQSLAALGLEAEARALQRCLLTDVFGGPGQDRVSKDTLDFWKAAVRL
jgi:hypothetical protein